MGILNRILLSILCFGFSLCLFGQEDQHPVPSNVERYQENLFVLANDSRFIPGERILFSIHNRLPDSSPSFVSRVCYLELIDSNKQSVLKVKVKLDQGRGQGHIYLPSYLQTGNYTLIAYTSWMLNFPRTTIPQFGIEIINPYNPIPGHFINDSLGIAFHPIGGSYVLGVENTVAYRLDRTPSMGPEVQLTARVVNNEGSEVGRFVHRTPTHIGNFQFNPPLEGNYRVILTDQNDKIYFGNLPVQSTNLQNLISPIPADATTGGNLINVRTDKSVYAKRDKVTLTLSSKNEELDAVSVSVRKVYDPTSERRHVSYNSNSSNSEEVVVDRIDRLPDFRSQVLYGRLDTTITSEVSLSSINGVPISSMSNPDGRFYFALPDFYDSRDWKLQTSGGTNGSITEAFLSDHSFVEVDSFIYRGNIRDWLKDKSVDVQIENAYLQFQSDSINTPPLGETVKDRIRITYMLDDYTRFRTMRETIVEIVNELKIKTNNGATEFVMPFVEGTIGLDEKALLVLDGIPITGDDMVQINPAEIKMIELVPERRRMGSQEYKGFVFFTSFDNDAGLLNQFDGYSDVEILPFQPSVTYFSALGKKVAENLPDHRGQMYWEPNFNLDNQSQIEFLTTDLTGIYEVIVQGIDSKGNYQFSKKRIEVR